MPFRKSGFSEWGSAPGHSPKKSKSQLTAGHSHRLTSGGKAVERTAGLFPITYCEGDQVPVVDLRNFIAGVFTYTWTITITNEPFELALPAPSAVARPR